MPGQTREQHHDGDQAGHHQLDFAFRFAGQNGPEPLPVHDDVYQTTQRQEDADDNVSVQTETVLFTCCLQAGYVDRSDVEHEQQEEGYIEPEIA